MFTFIIGFADNSPTITVRAENEDRARLKVPAKDRAWIATVHKM
jgi:hypothetical protein